jgi:hypothetical protein
MAEVDELLGDDPEFDVAVLGVALQNLVGASWSRSKRSIRMPTA